MKNMKIIQLRWLQLAWKLEVIDGHFCAKLCWKLYKKWKDVPYVFSIPKHCKNKKSWKVLCPASIHRQTKRFCNSLHAKVTKFTIITPICANKFVKNVYSELSLIASLFYNKILSLSLSLLQAMSLPFRCLT